MEGVSDKLAALPALTLYLVLVLLIVWPARVRHRVFSAGCTLSGVMALASACFLPWTGVPMAFGLGFPASSSYLWYPLIAAAVVLSSGGTAGLLPRAVWLFTAALSISALAWFAYGNGVPGFCASQEAVAMLTRLAVLRNGRFCTALVLFALCFVVSFCEIPGILAHRPIAFSYAGFLCIVFLPPDTSRFLPLEPPATVAADFLLSLLAAAAVQYFLFRWVQSFLSRLRPHRTRLLTPLLFAVAGLYYLFTSVA